MKKIIARLIVSGVVGIGIIILVMNVFFSNPNYIDCYNLMCKSFAQDGELASFETNIDDEMIQETFVDEIVFLSAELDILFINNQKLILVQSAESNADNLHKNVVDLCEKFKRINSEIRKYITNTSVPGFEESEKLAMASNLSSYMTSALDCVQKVNADLNDFLLNEFYAKSYSTKIVCDFVCNAAVKTYLNLETKDATEVANLKTILTQFKSSNENITAWSQNMEFVNFCNNAKLVSIEKVVVNDTEYRTSLTDELKTTFDSMRIFVMGGE